MTPPSGTPPTDLDADPPDDPNILAGEFVLGVLDTAQMQALASQMDSDPAWHQAVTWWQDRLVPLARLAPPEAPPEALWARIESSLTALGQAQGGQPARSAPRAAEASRVPSAPARGRLAQAWGNPRLWRGTTLAGAALAALFAGILVLRPPAAGPRGMAALAPMGAAAPMFMAALEPDGALVLHRMAPMQVASNRDLELWALPPGAKVPVSLGVMPPDGMRLKAMRYAQADTQLLVSLEPKGGSPTGLPTGPVLYAGTLVRSE